MTVATYPASALTTDCRTCSVRDPNLGLPWLHHIRNRVRDRVHF